MELYRYSANILRTEWNYIYYTGDYLQIELPNGKLNFRISDGQVFYSMKHKGMALENMTSVLVVGVQAPFDFLYPYPVSGDLADDVTSFEDRLGTGSFYKIPVNFISHDIEVRGSIEFKFYELIKNLEDIHLDKYPIITVQIVLENPSATVPLFAYAPLYTNGHGLLKFGTQSMDPTITFMSNGWQSWSENFLHDYSSKTPKLPIKIYRKMMINQETSLTGRYVSEMYAIIHDADSRQSIIMGFLTHADQFTRVTMDRLDDGRVSKLIAYSQTDSIQVCSLNRGLQQSEVAVISLVSAPESYEMLTLISHLTGKLAGFKVKGDVISGFCSWYYYYTKVSERDMIENIEFFEENRDIAIDMIQLDDGYQTCIGDWGFENEQFNDKFPQGLQWMSNRIHRGGFTSGLWIAPFFTTKKAELFDRYPEWTLKDSKGDEIDVMKNWGAMQYGLDTSREDVLDHIKRMSGIIVNKWNYDYIKIDFLFASAPLGAKYQDKYISRAQAIRKGVQAVRDGMGDKFLLGCGAPLGPCVGLVDAMRIGSDTAATWSNMEWIVKPVSKLEYPALKPALRATIQRSYMHNTLWVNDPDCVVVRENKSKLTMDEILLQLTVFGLSGGQVFVSDDEREVSRDRLELFKRIIPPYSPMPFDGIVSIPTPLDIMENKLPSLYARDIETCFGIRHLVSVISWQSKQEMSYRISELMSHRSYTNYDNNDRFLVFDYWREKLLGIYTLNDILKIEVPKHGCRYLIITQLNNDPIIFLSSSFHIIPGAGDVRSQHMDDGSLQMEFMPISKRDGTLFFYAEAVKPVKGDNCSAKLVMDKIIEVHCNTEKQEIRLMVV